MSEFIAGLASQQEFPFTDLSEDNMLLLGILLRDRQFAMQVHQQGESLMPAFQLTHNAVRRGTGEIFEGADRLRAISFGAAVFEAIATLVQATPEATVTDFQVVTKGFIGARSSNAVRNYISAVKEQFSAELPRTEVVVDAVARTHQEDGEYAIVGAALSRGLALDAETAKGEIVTE